MRVELDPDERDLLVELLRRELGDLKSQVRRAMESRPMHDELKRREERVEALLARLAPEQAHRPLPQI